VSDEVVHRLTHEVARMKYIKDDAALLPANNPSAHSKSKEWKDEANWGKEERIRILHSLNFYPYWYEKESHKLMILSYDMFDTLGLIEHFKIPRTIMQKFLLKVRERYRPVPFHNYNHAFNVAQSLYFFLTTCKAKEKFNQIELLSLLVSAFCHDVDHPGLSNGYQTTVGTKKAMIYNDTSVLENHHASETFKILSDPSCNILSTLSPSDYKLARKFILACIIATDLGLHGDYMTRLKSKLQWDNADDKKLIMCCLIKCADISNEIRPADIGELWAYRVMTEFFAQAGLEKAQNLPVLPHMDPEKTGTASGQIGFIGFLCLPLYQAMCTLFPDMQICCDQLMTNKQRWEAIDKKKKEAQQK